MSYKDMNAPDIVKEWKKIVNAHVTMGRDAKLIKDKLEILTPAQVLLGVYSLAGNRTVSIPRFVREIDNFIVEDETWAEVELARKISKSTPSEYYVWQDLKDSETYWGIKNAKEAYEKLVVWAERVLD